MAGKEGYKEFEEETLLLLRSANNLSALKRNIVAITNGLGFSDVDISVIQGTKNVGFFASTLPKSLHEAYTNEQLYVNDPILGHLCHSEEPVFDGNAYEYFINSPYANAPFVMQSKKIAALLKSYHFNESYTIPVHEKNTNSRFLFAIMDKHEKVDRFKKSIDHEKKRLSQFANIACKIVAFSHHAEALSHSGSPQLTKRQITILDLLSSLPTAQSQIADIMGHSKSTVEKDIRDIKEKLGTPNLYNCVRIAMTLKLIN